MKEEKSFEEGQKVLVINHFSTRLSAIKKITPKGFVRLENGDLYDENGTEKGDCGWYGRSTITNDETKINEFLDFQKRKEMSRKTVALLKERLYSKETLKQILELLREEKQQ